ncbi:unnamed protein product [Clonostachys rosea f. rosea IK726]|uniref:Uncharacterized protein n=1 Tax=Clonostachys rosea f. rosea IK726 TaxID=1349383 RepID=A0ACA9TXU2_BIOOC|nr:unnamed protein product [Clonostachys rosea f. rosea IK726]
MGWLGIYAKIFYSHESKLAFLHFGLKVNHLEADTLTVLTNTQYGVATIWPDPGGRPQKPPQSRSDPGSGDEQPKYKASVWVLVLNH